MSLRIGFIGCGRVGGALARALHAAGYEVGPLWSRSAARAEAAVSALPGTLVAPSTQDVADSSDLVIVAVPDRAIAPVAEAVAWSRGRSVVHTSGGTGVEALQRAADAGAKVGAWHPLKSFAGGADDADLRGITFAIEAGPSLGEVLDSLTRALGATPLHLAAADRARYHASAVLASNALVALLGEAASLWTAFGWTREQALAALLPLAQGAVDNVAALGLPDALTGPVERGDRATVERHLAALADAPPRVSEVYRVLSRAALDLAVEKGGIAGEQATELGKLLNDQPGGVEIK
jgi:predicted short-subunit dehydrogenase-like oxidoreductase (DUF2520 family)